MDKTIPLSDLREGERAVIHMLKTDDSTAARLRGIGFSEGTEVFCAGSGLFKDPAAYRVKGALIALRYRDARGVLCRKGENPT